MWGFMVQQHYGHTKGDWQDFSKQVIWQTNIKHYQQIFSFLRFHCYKIDIHLLSLVHVFEMDYDVIYNLELLDLKLISKPWYTTQ